MKKVNIFNYSYRRMLCLLVVLLTVSTASVAELRKRVLFSQDYETAQAVDWQSDPEATLSLVSDPVNGTCVQIEATEGNVGVWLPIELPDEVFFRDQQMSSRGYVVEFDFMIRSGNVADVSQSQFFLLTQGEYPYYSDALEVDKPSYYGLNAGGKAYTKNDGTWGWSLSQPVRDASTFSNAWYDCSLTHNGSPETLEGDKWYHIKLSPNYVKEGQFPGFWMEYTVWEKETNTYLYSYGSRINSLVRLTGFSALVGQGGMLKFDNLEVYDYSYYLPPTFELVAMNGAERTYKITNPNEAASTLYYTHELADEQPILGSPEYIRTTDKETTLTVTGTGNLYAYVATDDDDETPSAVASQAVVGVKQTLLAPYHWIYDYNAQTDECQVHLASDQSWLDCIYAPLITYYYSIDGGEYQTVTEDYNNWEATIINVPVGSELRYYATASGYNDSPVVTVTASVPFWNMGMQQQFYEEYGWKSADRTPIILGEEMETGLYQMKVGSYSFVSDYMLTPNENINENFMIRNYMPKNPEIYGSRREAPAAGQRHAAPANVARKTRNIEDIQINGIYSGDTRTYAVTGVKEGGYLIVSAQGVENSPVLTAVSGLEADLWNSESGPSEMRRYFKVTETGTARFTINGGTAIRSVEYYELAPPQMPYIYMSKIDGASRTYNIWGEGATMLHYATAETDEQPVLDSDAWHAVSGQSAQVEVTGHGYLFAYGSNSMGNSEVYSIEFNAVEMAMNTPFIYSKYYNSNTQLWTVQLYATTPSIDGYYYDFQNKIHYSIDGGEEVVSSGNFSGEFTIANGQQLTYYATANGLTKSATVTLTTTAEDFNDAGLQQKWYEYYGSSNYSSYYVMSLGTESTTLSGWYSLLYNGNQLSGRLLTQDENMDDDFRLRYYGLYSPVQRTYALTGLTGSSGSDLYIRIITNDEYSNAYITPVDGLEYDAWSSQMGTHWFKVTSTDGTVKFSISGRSYLRYVYLYQEPPYGYVDVADANGNVLKYYYESAESDAQLYSITSYADDETKAGRIVIADKVTDRKGNEHLVTGIRNSFNYNSNLKSIVFGQNIKTVASSAFYNCSQLESVTLNSALETLGSYAFENCYKLSSINLSDATSLTAIPDGCFYRAGLTEINIPSQITEIGSSAFYGCDSATVVTVNVANIPESCFQPNNSDKSKLTTINIGKNVKSIGNSAFYNQRHVTAVNIDPEVSGLAIGNSVFSNFDALETITLPAGVTSIGESLFYDCDNLKTVVFDENSAIEAIPNSCFNSCDNLETLTLPNSVKTVGTSVFSGCSSLRELTFGTGLEANAFPSNYWEDPFSNCSNLEKITLPGVNFPFQQQYSGLPNSLTLFVNAGLVDTYKERPYTNMYHIVPIGATIDFAIENEAGQLPLNLPDNKAPNAITLTITGQINGTDVNWIHQSMPYLQELILTDAQIVEGGEAVKRYNVNDGTVTEDEWNTETYPVKNDEFCDYMFYNMPMLKHIALPNGVKRIGKYALSCNYNSQLVQVDLPIALTAIDDNAFYSDSKLSKADLPAGLLTIGQSAFYETAITSVTIPEGVKSLGNLAFYNCNQLKTVVLPEGLETIGNSAFYDCENLETVNIPAQVVTIGDYAFEYCYKLQSAIVIPASCMSIGSYAFNRNYMLPSVTFSDDPNAALTTIGGSAFSYCKKIEQVTLPESLTSLGNSAFSNCESLKSFTFPTNIKQVPSSILYYCYNLETVTLAEGTTRIGSSAFYYCPKLATINLDGQPLTRIDDYAFYNTGLTSVTLPESLTSMGYYVFYNCTKLESANIPSQIKTVPSSTFSGCTSLTSVTLHDGITKIESSAFSDCKLLPGIALTDQVTSIGSSAFSGCDALEIEALPTSLKTIGSSAFKNTKAMNITLTIPETVTSLESEAFRGSGLTGVVFTKKPNSFSTKVFYECKQLTSVTLSDDITSIPEYTFYGCSALKSIDLPLTLTSIGNSAFSQSGLESIVLPQKLQSIGNSAFYKTQLTEIRVPKNVTSVGSYFAANNPKLKAAYLGRKQNYSNNSYFDYFAGCDNLELLRVYAGTPPSISGSYNYSYNNGSSYDYYLYYTKYRTNCVLEVPEGMVDTYEAANIWTDFKEIRVFESDDMMNDLDFAVMKDLYKYLDGASWKKPWDLSNQNHAIGKWQGITTEVDAEDDELFYITGIDLSEQGLTGPLPKSLFTLERLKTLNMSHNTIEAQVDTLLTEDYEPLTTLNMEGNHLKGDLYPLVSKLPNLTSLKVAYNWLTEYSQKTSNTKLSNGNMYRGYQFMDWKTNSVSVPEELEDEVVVDFTLGTPVSIPNSTLQVYRHEHGDYNLSFSYLYPMSGSYYSYDGMLQKNSNGLWDVYTGYVFKGKKGELTAYTHTMPSYSYITYILRADWEDGDVNADQMVDVTDLQNVIYYALNDQKPSSMIYNFTAADANGDGQINVSDIVGCVDYIMNYDGETPAGARMYNNVETDCRNFIVTAGSSLRLANADEVAALQLTISGATAAQLQTNGLRGFTVSARDVAGGVRVIIYSPAGNTLAPGESILLSGLPDGAAVTDARLADAKANRLTVSFGGATAISELMADELDLETMPIYDLSGRRVGKWNSLPRGIYIVNFNGKQYKVRK